MCTGREKYMNKLKKGPASRTKKGTSVAMTTFDRIS